jgi:hypothetical protein
MAKKKFSVISWNVEHFREKNGRTTRIAAFMKPFKPDIFAIYETEEVSIMQLMQTHFPDYDYFITDGPELQEILVGCRRGVFDQKVFTQKREFKVNNPALRPGALLSVQQKGKWHNLLFLHTDSGTDASAFGNRFEMLTKIQRMSEAITKALPDSGIIITGDLNTMGMSFPTDTKSNQRVKDTDEISGMGKLLNKNTIALAPKEFDATWISNGLTLTSNLDHVWHNGNAPLKKLGKRSDGNDYFVRVYGWQQLNGQERREYVDQVSDHCLLYFEVV